MFGFNRMNSFPYATSNSFFNNNVPLPPMNGLVEPFGGANMVMRGNSIFSPMNSFPYVSSNSFFNNNTPLPPLNGLVEPFAGANMVMGNNRRTFGYW